MWGFNRGRLSIAGIALLLIVSMAGYFLVLTTRHTVKNTVYDTQVEAAELMLKCYDVIKENKLALGLEIDPTIDLNDTGILGLMFSEITTTKGLLEAKRTSASPAFAALMVKYFTQLGLKEGDVVAIGASGSFPALVLASLCACQVMNLDPITIYSIGSSMYGSNVPEYTFADMLNALNDAGLVKYTFDAILMGGVDDLAMGIVSDEGRELILEAIERSGVENFIQAENLEASIKERIKTYVKVANGRPIKCFVNVGGAPANYGNTTYSLNFPNGLVTNLQSYPIDPERGLIFDFAAMGIPVIHLLDIRGLALKSNIVIDPVPFPEIGTEGVYYTVSYNKSLIFLTLIASLGVVVWDVYGRKRKSSGQKMAA